MAEVMGCRSLISLPRIDKIYLANKHAGHFITGLEEVAVESRATVSSPRDRESWVPLFSESSFQQEAKGLAL